MSIRLRHTPDAGLVALCAARSIAQPGDVYLDDAAHAALAQKFWLDYPACGISVDPAVKAAVEREESGNANRRDWDARYGATQDAAGSVVLAVDPSRSTPDESETVIALRAALATERATLDRRGALLRDAERLLEKATTRLAIVQGRMHDCDATSGTDKHRLSLFELPGWIDEQHDALAAIRTELADTPEAG